MTYNPECHHRRSLRLKGYDYAGAGWYFVTLCTWQRECLFGEVVDGGMRLNEVGGLVRQCWEGIPVHFPHVELDEFVVMPNHVHGILCIMEPSVGAKNFSPLQPFSRQLPGTARTIGSIVRGVKIGVTKWMRTHTSIHEVWQRNYFERVIRDDDELAAIRDYIATNPLQWDADRNHPNNL